jgi:outer membrane receptor protein involved in Fe transport
MALAQSAPTPGAAAPGTQPAPATNELQEIVVTAQKRSEKINDLGMAITAATGAQLTERNITDVEGLTRLEPSFQVSVTQTGTPVYTIRGVGYYEQSLTATPTVSVYQDEVPYTYPLMTKGALLDVKRVEVLKGPQGTLYGQNATGGAINFIANQPTSDFQAGVGATYGRFNAVDVAGFISGPIAPDLTARIAGRLQKGGAWQESVTRGDTLGNQDNKFGRLLLDWKPTEEFKANLNLHGWTDHSDTQAGALEGLHFASPRLISTLTPKSPLPVKPYSQYPALIQKVLAEPIAPNNDQAADWVTGTHPRADEQFYQAALRLDYSPSEAFNVTSLTNYEHFSRHDSVDLGATAALGYIGLETGDVSTVSQEIRLDGRVDGKLYWLLGANYDHSTTNENDLYQNVTSTSYITAGTPYNLFTEFNTINGDRASTAAIFANLQYNILPNLDIHGGVRYTVSDQSLSDCTMVNSQGVIAIINGVSQLLGGHGGATLATCSNLNFNLDAGAVTYQKLDQTNVPWRVGVDWKVTPESLLYVSASEGYKAGSAPAIGGVTAASFLPVTQESLRAYEAGFKSTLFDGMLQLNADAFYYDYRNKQFLGRLQDPLGIFGLIQRLFNVPTSKEDGLEVSADWRPITGLTLNAAATYLDSEVTSNFINYASYATGAADTVNFKGESFPFTPKWSVHYGARYEWPFNNDLLAFASADASHQSSMVPAFGAAHDASQGPPLEIPGYSLLDLALGVRSESGRWSVQIWGKNVTNTYYLINDNVRLDAVVKMTGMPATYGVTAGKRW